MLMPWLLNNTGFLSAHMSIVMDFLKTSLGDRLLGVLVHAPRNNTVEAFPSCLCMYM
jgi:hypothetical protein